MYSIVVPFLRCSSYRRSCQIVRWKSTLRKINKLLVANRGEIACRVMRTAKRLGIKTVAVYSDVDAKALHVCTADEAFYIGQSVATQSYLRGDNILKVARLANCQAIHPGYGFLSENVEFAESCQKEGVIFIGPPASAIRDMGIKSTSKRIMSQAGVPIIEGYHGDDQSNENLEREAVRIGFPVMIKAVRGGGGKGMRIAHCQEEFIDALESARTESQKAFGDSVVLLEKFIAEPRHVEVQVFADSYGDAVHLYERDCSVQRRHQKIIEEAPAPGLSWELRKELGDAAVRAAKAVGYVGAGTVEFILGRNSHSFHFMEMNTRLQVEHPITEMITGIDLVEWQINIASGEKLSVKQEDIPLKGHAFEARIYAEDPRGGFLPGAGRLLYLCAPKPEDDVRVETGVREGDEVSVHYDPMIAKLVVWGNNRFEALLKLRSKLMEYNIAGLATNVSFLLDLSNHPEFEAGNVHTNFIQDYSESLFTDDTPTKLQLIQAGLATVLLDRYREREMALRRNDAFNPFILESNFRVNYVYARDVKLKFKQTDYVIGVKILGEEHFSVSCDNGNSWVDISAELELRDKFLLHCTMDGFKTTVNIFGNKQIIALFGTDGKMEFSYPLPLFLTEEDSQVFSGLTDRAVAPMPGILDKLLVKAGDYVKAGDPLFVLIAMKMEHVVKANSDVKISDILYKVGDSVNKDDAIIKFDQNE